VALAALRGVLVAEVFTSQGVALAGILALVVAVRNFLTTEQPALGAVAVVVVVVALTGRAWRTAAAVVVAWVCWVKVLTALAAASPAAALVVVAVAAVVAVGLPVLRVVPGEHTEVGPALGPSEATAIMVV
jgi:hypothetical protein